MPAEGATKESLGKRRAAAGPIPAVELILGEYGFNLLLLFDGHIGGMMANVPRRLRNHHAALDSTRFTFAIESRAILQIRSGKPAVSFFTQGSISNDTPD
jgi:hypothetical protein